MRLIHTFAVAGLLLVGCQTQTGKESANSTTLLPPTVPVHTQQPPTPGKGVAFDTDDCAARLQTLAGQLMLYYFKYQKLPNQLAELQAIADPGEDVPAVCPVSHQPYVYNPVGLVFGDDARRLIVYDAAPSHAGTRWGILFGQAKGREPVNMIVIQIPEPSMVGYRPAPALPSTAQPSQTQEPSQTPQTIDQLSPELREKVLQQQRQLRKEIDARRQQQQQDPQQPVQQPIQQQPNPQQPGPQQQQ